MCPPDAPSTPTSLLVQVRDLNVRFHGEAGWFAGRRRLGHAVLRGVSLDISRGLAVGLVGESGSGKTTLARAILRLIPAESGTVLFDGIDVLALNAAQLRALRRRMQLIFQDPYGSLNPRLTVGQILAEPIRVHRLAPTREVPDRIAELLRQVGLRPDHAARYPHEFSGGQRQRIGIARALAVQPGFIVCDEPVSALDVSIQAQILNLLKDLQEQLGLTYLFIGHNLDVIAHFCDQVVVMRSGEIVERGPTADIRSHPQHPYTQALLAASPRLVAK